jgi:hypothetical protein
MKATRGKRGNNTAILSPRPIFAGRPVFQVQHEKSVNTRNGGSKSWRTWCEGRKGGKKMKKHKSHVIERDGKEVVFCHPFAD